LEIMSREAARAAGLKVYFIGEPCKLGHISTRRADNGNCEECARAKTAAWQNANRERCRASARRWNAAHPERKRVLGKESYDRRRGTEDSARRVMVRNARSRAKTRELEFSLTLADVVIPPRCPVLGLPLVVSKSRTRFAPDSPTLDRIDNTRGYVPGNVFVVSYRANALKSDGSAEEHEQIAGWMRERGVA
jgi:hypothetical protein